MDRRAQGRMQSLSAASPRAELYSDSLFRETDPNVQLNHSEMRDYAILPRRKAGQSVAVGERAPVLLTKSVLSNYFGMPLSAAAKELGICATAIKKVCRKLGILKWPFRDRHLHARIEQSVHSSSYSPSSADDSSTEGGDPIKLQSHRWSDFLTAKTPLSVSEHRHRPEDMAYECDDHAACSASNTPSCKKECEPCRPSVPGMCAPAHVRFASPISSRLDGIVEVDASSSPSDAAADSASEAEPLDCVVSMCDEHGLLGGLAGGADDEDVLGMTADADFFAASAGGNPTWASVAAAREDGSAAAAAAAASAGDCAEYFAAPDGFLAFDCLAGSADGAEAASTPPEPDSHADLLAAEAAAAAAG
mmetsp:Transcript_43142/g.90306  ORF Transcript_43142/g.90306 Transcript_43142/m.90306 type:complete len:363 (-) Transcript_43142:25-1113(-)